MAIAKSDAVELTYPLRTAVRLTGLSPGLLRAWERRHRVVEPFRTPGGTRRYGAADLDRLRLVKAAVDAGHRIGEVARLEPAELKRRSAVAEAPSEGRLDETLTALGCMNGSSQITVLYDGHLAYRIFARNRLRWTGRASACEAGECQVVAPHATASNALESQSLGSGR